MAALPKVTVMNPRHPMGRGHRSMEDDRVHRQRALPGRAKLCSTARAPAPPRGQTFQQNPFHATLLQSPSPERSNGTEPVPERLPQPRGEGSPVPNTALPRHRLQPTSVTQTWLQGHRGARTVLEGLPPMASRLPSFWGPSWGQHEPWKAHPPPQGEEPGIASWSPARCSAAAAPRPPAAQRPARTGKGAFPAWASVLPRSQAPVAADKLSINKTQLTSTDKCFSSSESS